MLSMLVDEPIILDLLRKSFMYFIDPVDSLTIFVEFGILPVDFVYCLR